MPCDEHHNGVGHIRGIVEECPQKAYGAKLERKPEAIIGATPMVDPSPIRIIEVEILGELRRGRLVGIAAIAPFLFCSQKVNRHARPFPKGLLTRSH